MAEIKRQSREKGFNSFHFSFSGGEPTLHPSYLDLLRFYAEDTANTNYQSVHMTTNLSAGNLFWKKYIEAVAPLHRASVTASWHREAGVKDPKSHKEKFAEKLIYLQENEIQTTINMVMVPKWFDEIWAEAMFFHDCGLNVTLKPQSDSTASQVVPEYTPEQLKKLHLGMPQRNFTEARMQNSAKNKTRPIPHFNLPKDSVLPADDGVVPQFMQVELTDFSGKRWYLDQAERFNAFNFNKFCGWKCESGYRSIVIREPDGNIKRSYSCKDEPLGNIVSGFTLFHEPQKCITPTCVSSADSKIPKYRN
jgi:MoaA/NifB/PqqE/SkfB family radical SAM enzyme